MNLAQPIATGGVCALIIAGGQGTRFSNTMAKSYAMVSPTANVLQQTIKAFLEHPLIDYVQVVINQNDQKLYQSSVESLALLPPSLGGDSRQKSVYNGLASISCYSPEKVLIHDAARPFVSKDLITRVIDQLRQYDAVVPVININDSIIKARDNKEIDQYLNRDNVKAVQTPQGFDFSTIWHLHQKYNNSATVFTDDASMCILDNLTVNYILGDVVNKKITTASDLDFNKTSILPDVRVGNGFDVHAITNGDGVVLCGVKIPANITLVGHSDADVALHSITDAILGAIGEADIGHHFPATDEKWRGVESAVFLKKAADLVSDKGGIINHIDVTIIGEKPTISPYRQKMIDSVANILQISPIRVSVKATTTEKLGFCGRGEGIAAIASATICII